MPNIKNKPITCTRSIAFDAAHRVMGHEGKCKHLHGHRYTLEAIIKELLGTWIDEHWDHTTILFDQDKPLGKAISAITGQKIFYLPANPTAENMAEYLFSQICPELFASMPIECVRVRLYETPNCYAELNI